MPRKKSKKSQKNNSAISLFWSHYKDQIIWFSLIFLWILIIFAKSWTPFWDNLILILENLFWYYYKAILIPSFIAIWFFLIKDDELEFNLNRFIWIILLLSALVSLFSYFVEPIYNSWIFNISWFLTGYFWKEVTVVILLSMLLLSLFATFRLTIWKILEKLNYNFISSDDLESKILDKKSANLSKKEAKAIEKKEKEFEKKKLELESMLSQIKEEKEALQKARKEKQLMLEDAKKDPQKVKIENKSKEKETWIIWWLFWKTKVKIEKWSSPEKWTQTSLIQDPDYSDWELPPIKLLKTYDQDVKIDEDQVEKRKDEIQEKLAQFKIKVDMLSPRIWPTVIQYRLEPSQWIKLNRIENLKKDLTLALKAKSIRIQAPIPWEWVVWIEVPNDKREMVWIKEVIASETFNNKKIKLPLSLWKDVSWNIVVWDLTKMPHLLVAWQTASGKSVWMNGFLVSLLYRFSPSQLKFIMIDPKMVELSVYDWIPHLLTPVITNPDKATNALKWCVAEMLRRYDLQKQAVARNVEEYNAKVAKDKRLPYIVIVIDELADLMMSWNKKDVETSIARIAQMARAVWMHLIVATQRPSVDVITGLIKANIPSRIAFTVASQIDSRTVIDKAWAEDLLGYWDMLYYPTGASGAERVQWVYVDTEEVESLVNKLKLTIDEDLLDNLQDPSIVNWKSTTEGSVMAWYDWDADEDPEMVEKAIQVVREAKKWSTSLIQRKLGLWYGRAAKLLDILEELGVVWPPNGSKPREVYE